MRNLKIILARVAIFIATLIFSNHAWANSLGVDPLYVEILPGKSTAVRVTNFSDIDTPVELFIDERVVDQTGKQFRKDAEDAFIIFPPQAIIKANKTQVFRIQTLRKDLNESQSYFLSVRQIPVDLGQEEGSVRLQVVFAFDVAVHLIPRGVKAKPIIDQVKLTSLEIAPESELGETSTTVPAVELTLRNDGNKFLYLQDQNYIASGINADGSPMEPIEWSADEILSAVKVVLVNPGTSRTFKLPLPKGPNPKEISIKIRPRK
jgi:fimbrial chaperone protein